MVYLKKPSGPQTCFKVFGSPCTPGSGNWAFEYQENDAQGLWAGITHDVDFVVTHTPPRGHCDAATKAERSGCAALLERLAHVRPLLHVCGHIHEARGIERIRWSPSCNDSLVDSVEHWQDPGHNNKKMSLLDLTSTSQSPLGHGTGRTRQSMLNSLQYGIGGQPDLSMPEFGILQPDKDNLSSTSSLIQGALQASETLGTIEDSGAAVQRCRAVASRTALRDDSSFKSRFSRYDDRVETAVINAALLGPRINGKTTGTNKPIVVDIDLPVWKAGGDGNV